MRREDVKRMQTHYKSAVVAQLQDAIDVLDIELFCHPDDYEQFKTRFGRFVRVHKSDICPRDMVIVQRRREFPIPVSMVADRLGISSTTLSRLMARLHIEGEWMSRGGRRFKALSEQEFAKIVAARQGNVRQDRKPSASTGAAAGT